MFYQINRTKAAKRDKKCRVLSWWSWPLTLTFKLVQARDQTRFPCEFGANPFCGSRDDSGDISFTNKILTDSAKNRSLHSLLHVVKATEPQKTRPILRPRYWLLNKVKLQIASSPFWENAFNRRRAGWRQHNMHWNYRSSKGNSSLWIASYSAVISIDGRNKFHPSVG